MTPLVFPYSSPHGNREDLPELKKDTLRLYSMRFCPFVQRVRLVLIHKGIPHETINVNLSEKPDWLFERNPLGKVPVLEYNDQMCDLRRIRQYLTPEVAVLAANALVLYESKICNDYLDEVYPDKPLNPKDPYVKARHRILLEQFSQWISMFYKFMHSGASCEESLATMHRLSEEFDKIVEGKPFFGGSEPGMLDYNMWPWFERTSASGIFQGKVMPEGKYPNLRAWMNNMYKTDAVKATAFDPDMYDEFYKGYVIGTPDYDIGLDK